MPPSSCDIDPTNWYYCDLIRVPHTSLENQHFQGWVGPPTEYLKTKTSMVEWAPWHAQLYTLYNLYLYYTYTPYIPRWPPPPLPKCDLNQTNWYYYDLSVQKRYILSMWNYIYQSLNFKQNTTYCELSASRHAIWGGDEKNNTLICTIKVYTLYTYPI